MRRKVFTGFVIVWMIVIFMFSARNAEVSSQDSSRVGMLAGRIFFKDFNDWDLREQISFAQKIDYPVRKTAHATEYAILGILLFGALYQTREWKRRTTVLSWGAGTFYAVTDEIHQLFVPGRSGQITDVMIDSTGVAAGVLFLLLLLGLIQKIAAKSDQTENV